MTYYPGNAATFAGYPVVEWTEDKDILADSTDVAVAIRCNWGEPDEPSTGIWRRRFMKLLRNERIEQIPALIIGMWSRDESVDLIIETLVENKARFPKLKALFVGDITSEENEISWIEQGDLSPLWSAFPDLETLVIRGSNGLELGKISMPKLKTLRIETGGMPAEVVRSVGAGDFPALEMLILWLGTRHYGGSVARTDLHDFYQCKGMPKLNYLGLCNSEIADEIAIFISTAPVLKRLETLDLSMGTLSDDGALALVTSPYIRGLKKLILEHHFCSAAMMKKLKALERFGMVVDVSDQRTERRDNAFVAVGE